MKSVPYSPLAALRFYVPLLLQAFSQSLTYPLVGSIATRGPYGVDGFTAFTQGQIVMFFFGALAGGLVMTGMVFARTRAGYDAFRRLNARMMFALVAVQMLVAATPLGEFVFGALFNLPSHLTAIACRTLFWGAVMQAGFFMRNVPLVVLFNAYASTEANYATLARIALTVAFALAFPHAGLVGPEWGLFALTVPVLLEWGLTALFARRYAREIPDGVGASAAAQFKFTMPLSLGSGLLAFSPFLTAAFVGRSASATDMLGVHYVTLGVANPVSYAALRMQAVAIQFPPEYAGDRRLLKFAVAMGLVLGVVPLAFSLPGLGPWYYGVCQNLPPRLVPTAMLMSFCYAFIEVVHAVRGRVEGLAAWRKRPRAVMCGQIAYFVMLGVSLAVLLPLGVPGWLMALVAIFAAPLAAIAAVYAALNRGGGRFASKEGDARDED